MTMVYLATLITLMTQQYSDPVGLISSVMRCISATPHLCAGHCGASLGSGLEKLPRKSLELVRPFRRDRHPRHDASPADTHWGGGAVVQLQKLFLTCVALKLVQKNHALNQLFKTAFASLPAILSRSSCGSPCSSCGRSCCSRSLA